MRLTDKKIAYLSKVIVKKLKEQEDVKFTASNDVVERKVGNVFLDNMKIEDEIDREVKKILEQHQREIKDGKIDYHHFFKKVKDQIVKQKGIVI